MPMRPIPEKYRLRLHTPAGTLTVTATGEAIVRIDFGDVQPTGADHRDAPAADPAAYAPVAPRAAALLERAARELKEYFAGTRRDFTLPLAPAGTPFQLQVWRALRAIPYGETRTYGQIAAAVGRPKASRAVGGANNRNPLPIVIPCHRVIGSNGQLTGYAGGLETKRLLLRLERPDPDRPRTSRRPE